jgi:hypothetical protein
MNVFCFAEREHAELFRERFGGEFIDPKDRLKWPVAGDCMSPGNRYARETGIGRTLGQLFNEKMALVAICRRCMHPRVSLPCQFHWALRRTLPGN